jgi:cytochrome c oxidase assembly factor CtaG
VLAPPSFAALVTAWTMQPAALGAALVAAGWYLACAHRARWERGRAAVFAAGLALLLWTTCGFPGAYADRLYWVRTVQLLGLLLVVPFVLLLGHPVQLACAARPDGVITRLRRRRAVRVLASPLSAPLLVAVMSVVLFFGPLPVWTQQLPFLRYVVELVVAGVGIVVLLPLTGVERPKSSLAVGVAMLFGSLEVLVDALPGALLRLDNKPATSWFDLRRPAPWLPTPLHDQHLAGGVLFTVGELLCVPLVVLLFRQWVQADARDAAEVDVVLEAERAVRQALHGESDVPDELVSDLPWWLSDPSMQERLRRSG